MRFKTVWVGTLFWASFSGGPAVVAAICSGHVFFIVWCSPWSGAA